MNAMKHRREFFLVLLIVAVAAFFRLYQLDAYPPGLYPDEAMNGNNAIQAIETGDYKLFYPENNGREGLFIAIQSLSIRIFGNTAYALRVVSALAGTLTVLGLYFLGRRLFNWQIGAISSFLMAVSFWHVNFSRIGFRAIMAPLIIVWGTYFFWKGLTRSSSRSFIVAGIIWGLGFYTYISFRIMPFMLIAAALAYWQALDKNFNHDRYVHTRNELFRGIVVWGMVALLVVLPLAWHFYTQPEDFLGRLNKVSVFSSDNPVFTILKNTGQTLAMFNFVGDHNWRHNFSGRAMLYWPVGILAMLGFFKSILKLERSYKNQGHFSPTHVLILSWFALGLLPVVLSTEGLPHSLRAIVIIPAVFLFAAEGLWWFFEFSKDWWRAHDVHERHIPFIRHSVHESTLISVVAVTAFMIAVGIVEFKTYFYDWARRPEVVGEFNQNYVDVANRLKALPQSRIKYVLVNRDTGVSVNGIPITAQTVMYLTDTYTQEKQKAKNIYYLTPQQYAARQYLPNAIVLPLEEKK
jgi:4-amino-4-deoxy-L-arabinose transferase-like glycosyltransferase